MEFLFSNYKPLDTPYRTFADTFYSLIPEANDVIQIMSPGGYVTLPPDRPLDQIYAHAGVSGTEIPVSWEELKDQIVESCNFNEADGSWYLLTAEPSLDCPTQTIGM